MNALPTNSITAPINSTPAAYTALDRRTNTSRPVEQVTVIDVTEQFDYNKLPGTPAPNTTPYIVSMLGWIMIGVGILGAVHMTADLAFYNRTPAEQLQNGR